MDHLSICSSCVVHIFICCKVTVCIIHLSLSVLGLPPQGMVLDKTFILVVSARGARHYSPLEDFPALPADCHFFSQASKSSSQKVRTYPQMVQDYKQLQRSKSGLNMFEMLPSSEKCKGDDVPSFELMKMIKLGEYLAGRYGQHLPSLLAAGKDPTLASCRPEQDFYQGTFALLHGLLSEKQFVHTKLKKLERHMVRGLDDHVDCTAIKDVEVFLRQAYMEEHEIFKNRDSGFPLLKHFFQGLGIRDLKPAKEMAKSLSHMVCSSNTDLCYGDSCFNLTQDGVRQLWQLIAFHNSYLSSSEIFRSYALADTHTYIERLFGWFAGGGTPHQAMKIDMVDEYFYLKVLAALGYEIQEPLMPGARVVIEQYRKDRGNGKKYAMFWRALVNGKIVTADLASCRGTASKEVCGVDTIKTHLQESKERNMFGICTHSKDEL